MADSTAPDVSIVVAAVNTRVTLRRWLDLVAPQVARHRVQVLVAAPFRDAFLSEIESAYPFARFLSAGADALVPALWGAGIAEARAPVVAMTISPCAPDPDWIDAIVAAHAAPHAGIGGVIDCAPDAGLVDRALHLVRYTPYLPPLPPGPVPEVAGDNGTYKRAALEPWMAAIAREGFWESEFHRELHARGESLWLDPRIRVTHAASYSAAAFSRQRFLHGREFGRKRRGPLSAAARLARAGLAPTVPVVMLVRALRAVSRRGRLDARTLAAAPVALWFFSCWAAGEAAGLLGA